jgi:hypothetical protein
LVRVDLGASMERWFDRTGGRGEIEVAKGALNRDPANLQRAEKERIHMNLSDCRSS